MKVIVTGAAGFIGFHTAKALLDRGDQVVGIDCINDYYDVNLKNARLKQLEDHPNFQFFKIDITDKTALDDVFQEFLPEKVIHLAAQAGVRYSLENPYAYIDANIVGFLNILEACRNKNIQHLVYASSSSVYGANTHMPFGVHQNVDHPLSLYAASKKSNELMAHTYAHLYRLPVTGLRFFTVYGPWGRPDMALFIFTKRIIEGEPINVHNNGDHERDFTYIDDIVEGVIRCLDNTAAPNPDWSSLSPDPSSSNAPYRLFNIGNNTPIKLIDFINLIEENLGREAKMNFLPMQAGDVPKTFADIDALEQAVDFAPKTSIEDGIKNFVNWYREFYSI